MIRSLPYAKIKFDKNVESENKLDTEDHSDFGYILETDLK